MATAIIPPVETTVDPDLEPTVVAESEQPHSAIREARVYVVIRGRKPGMYETNEEYQHQMFGVPNAIGKSFATRTSAEAFLNHHINAGNVEEIHDAPSMIFTPPLPSNSPPIAIAQDRQTLPIIPDMQCIQGAQAFLVLRGYAPGVYRTCWEAALNAYRGAMAGGLIKCL
ncbi:hypothetical protein HWV62_32830 [Athelia sp. TMB]|nr:hypothetical protein HWV62_32830 [Athelia sp. TMB]